ncbi:MAG: Ig-like domain-containing protein [Proteobacteria bacterium]|nr:Ig-like domain-containing protein [Pseudomonadota bacterium]
MTHSLLGLLLACDLGSGTNATLDVVHQGTPSCSSSACHPDFTTAGSVFSDLDGHRGLGGAELRVTDSSGRTSFVATSTELGLLYSLEPLPTGPLTFQLGDQRSDEHVLPNDRDCNLCHRADGAQGTEGALVASDRFPPRLLLSTPSDQAQGVDPQGALELLFSEPLDPASLSSSGLHLEGVHGRVELEVSASVHDETVYVRPLQELEEEASYALVLERSLTDLAGNPLDSQQRVEFQTSGDRGPRVQDSEPAAGDTGVSPDTVVSVWFAAPLQTSSVSEDTVWLDVSCAPSGADVSYDAQESRIDVQPRSDLTRGLHCALHLDGLRSEGGVEQESPVLVVFETEDDTLAPVAEALLPPPGSPRVSPDSLVQVRFDEQLDAGSLQADAFWVEDAAGRLDGELILDDDGRTLTWSAQEALPSGELLLSLDPPPSDRSGNEAQLAAWSFQVGLALDVAAPRVTGTSPQDGSIDNDPEAPIRVGLSEPPDLRTLSAERFTLSCSGADQELTPRYDPELGSVELELERPLPAGAFCAIEVHDGLRDLSGNERDETERFYFGVTGDGEDAAPFFAGIESLEATSETTLEAGWSAASDDSTPRSELVYRLYAADTEGGQDYTTPTLETSAGRTWAELEDLAMDSTWYVVVRAVDSDGQEDTNEVELFATTWPAVSFADTILPILEDRCTSCHGDGHTYGGLDVTSHSDLMRSGTVIPYSSTSSSLFTKGSHHSSGWFSADESTDIASWIDQGALDN